jgi:DNA-binding SARP family transcriptional activator
MELYFSLASSSPRRYDIMDKIIHVFGRTGDSAVVMDTAQNIVYWNTAAEKIFGYDSREVLGKKCYDLFQGRTRDGEPVCRQDCAVITQIKQGDTVSHFDMVVQNARQEDIVINISTLNISEGHPNPHPALVQLSHELASGILGDGKLRIFLLGTTAVVRPEGTRVNGELWRRVKVRALLAYLVLQRDRPVPRDTLVELLWPELDYNAALRNLNTTVYNLRKSLEPHLARVSDSNYVIYEGGSYCLHSDVEHWLDIDAFETYVKQARAISSLPVSIRAYEKAVALYQGEYLADLQTTAVWSPAEHIRLQELYLTALEELGEHYEAIQEDTKAKELYLKALSVDGTRESTVQKLMKLAMRQGDYATARSHCARLVHALKNDLGVSPSPVTQALCRLAQCQ